MMDLSHQLFTSTPSHDVKVSFLLQSKGNDLYKLTGRKLDGCGLGYKMRPTRRIIQSKYAVRVIEENENFGDCDSKVFGY